MPCNLRKMRLFLDKKIYEVFHYAVYQDVRVCIPCFIICCRVNCTLTWGDRIMSIAFAHTVRPSQILYRLSNEEVKIWYPFTDGGSSINNAAYVTTRHSVGLLWRSWVITFSDILFSLRICRYNYFFFWWDLKIYGRK